MKKNKVLDTAHVTVSTSDLALFLNVSSKTLAAWVKVGMPKLKYGCFDLCSAFAWWLKNISNPATEKEKNARADYWEAKATKGALEVEALKDSHIDISEIEAGWKCRADQIEKALSAIADDYTALLPGKSAEEIRQICQDYIYQLRCNFAKHGKFVPVVMPGLPKRRKQR